jgi:cytochrome P450
MTAAGEAPDILSPEFATDPYRAYRIMLEDLPLIWHEATNAYIISRYEEVMQILRDPTFTTDNYAWQVEPAHGGRTIIQMSGHEHSVRRALVAPAFRGKELQQKFLPVIERNARRLIDGFREAGSVDLVADFARLFPINVIVDMLGLDQNDRDRFQRWYTSIIAFLGNLNRDPGIKAAGKRTRKEFAEYLLPIIRQRRGNLGDDLLSVLCAAEVDGTHMSDEDIKAFCSLLLAAGGETTDKAIASLFKNLLEHPDQLHAVREDRSLISKAFAETLRYTPPVHMVLRQLGDDVELHGTVMSVGSTVICLIAAANRDGRRFAEPDSFDIFRDDLADNTAFSAAAQHLSFGLGRHFCVGALLARAEVEVATNQLLDALPDITIEAGHTPVEQGVFTRGPASLPVRFTPTGTILPG